MKTSPLVLPFLACLGLIALSPRTSTAQERPYTEGTVWEVTYVRTEPGMTEEYLRNLQANWKRVNDAAIEKGYVVSYKILSTQPTDRDDWDLMLLVEYPNMASFDGAAEKFDALTEPMLGSRGQQQTATVERGELREIMGTVIAREFNLR